MKQFSQLSNIGNLVGQIQLVNKALTIDVSSSMSLVCYELVHLVVKLVFSNIFIIAQFVFLENMRNIEKFER